jgi:VanZ family protein
MSPSSYRTRRLAAGLLLVYWLTILVGTHLPKSHPAGSLVRGGDKLVHFLAFAGLGWLLAWSAAGWGRLTAARGAGLWLVVVLYGAIDELSQSLVTGRDTSLHDWIADGLGGLAGLLAFFFVQRWRAAQLRPPAASGAGPAPADQSPSALETTRGRGR